jgi:hypothetical protein
MLAAGALDCCYRLVQPLEVRYSVEEARKLEEAAHLATRPDEREALAAVLDQLKRASEATNASGVDEFALAQINDDWQVPPESHLSRCKELLRPCKVELAADREDRSALSLKRPEPGHAPSPSLPGRRSLAAGSGTTYPAWRGRTLPQAATAFLPPLARQIGG